MISKHPTHKPAKPTPTYKHPPKRKLDSLSARNTTNLPSSSGFTISSLPSNLTQSTPHHHAPPPATASTTDLTLSLEKDHTLHPLSIISSTRIQTRVRRALDILSTQPDPDLISKDGRSPVVVLTARADVAAKCISVVEIVKREMAASTSAEGKPGRWFQYTSVEGRVLEKKKEKRMDGKRQRREPRGKGGGRDAGEEGDGDEDGEDGDEETFEVMKTPLERAIEGIPKIREVPFMTIYLSSVRIDALKKKYGEQTNSEPLH